MNPMAQRLGMLFTAATLACGATLAQTVVRCGNAYGETSCPGGTLVPADDPRTAGQRAQAKAVITRDARMADALEAARLKAEAQAQPSRRPTSARSGRAAPVEQEQASSRKNRPAPVFQAVAPAGPDEAARLHKGTRKAASTPEQKNGRAVRKGNEAAQR